MNLERTDAVIGYFKSPQWKYFLEHVLNQSPADVYHAHVYVRTNIHPEDLAEIMEAYLEHLGCPVNRSIDRCAHYPPAAGLHGILPSGKTFFDFFFLYDDEAVLSENTDMPLHSPLLEHEHSLLIWTAESMKQFARQFSFEPVGIREKEAIENYFLSRHWKETIRQILDPEVVHAHSYVNINFDPVILEQYATRVFRQMGWMVERVVPCTFDVHGEWRGKISYVFGYPEKMYDIGWNYTPGETIAPSREIWCLGTRGYDLWTKSMWNDCINAGNYTHLTTEELVAIKKRILTEL